MTPFELNSTTSSQCLNLSLLADDLIEGNETISLTLEEVITSNSFGIRQLEPRTTNITIIDTNCKFSVAVPYSISVIKSI